MIEFNQLSDDNEGGSERAVSPVIGVILMVAITVILAAVIATFVLDLGQGMEKDVQAGASVEGDGTSEVTITWTSEGTADHLEIRGGNINSADIGADTPADSDVYLSSVGEATTLTQSGSNNIDINGDGTDDTNVAADTYSVVAVGPDGKSTTIQTFEITT